MVDYKGGNDNGGGDEDDEPDAGQTLPPPHVGK